MSDRKSLLRKLAVGDIFHAVYPNGASVIGLVLSVDENTIQARRVTTQEHLSFDRQTGIESASDGKARAVINSVAPLPREICDVILGLDQRYRYGEGDERFKLTQAELQAFRFLDSHHSSNPV